MRLQTLLGVAIAAISSTSATAFAYTFHPHPGSFCHGEGLAYSSLWGVHNPTSITRKAICPIQRDQGQQWNQLRSVEVFVFDRHQTDAVRCRVRILTEDWSVFFEEPVRETQGFSSFQMPPIQLTFSNVMLSPTSVLTLECDLPPRTDLGVSHISMYVSDES